jgi:DNA-binding response OmpR family regulator
MKNNKKILVVEDEEILMEAMQIGLSKSGFTTLKAYNGEEGLEIALREHPDLILLDVMMPVMDGVEMLKKLREDDWGKSVKVIYLTNVGDTDKIADSLGNGVRDYLLKANWTVEKIIEKVNEKLNIKV